MNKKVKSLLLAVCIMIVATAIIYNNVNGIKNNTLKAVNLPKAGDAFELGKTKLQINSKVIFSEEDNIYKFKKTPADVDFVKELAEMFGIYGNISDNVQSYSISSDGIGSVSVEKDTSMWSYHSYEKSATSSEDNINISDDETVIKIAKSELKKYNLSIDLFDNPIVANETYTNATETTPVTYAKNIFFYKKINGQPILGTSRIIVSIGNNNKIRSISKYYRDIEEKTYKVKLKKQSKIIDEIKRGKGIVTYDGKKRDPENIEITSARLSYWEDPDNDCLQPVYHLTGYNTEDKADVFSAYIPAIEDGQTID